MKKTKGSIPEKLTGRQILAIQSDLNVILGKPKHVKPSANEQYGIYDENGEHVDDVMADGKYFLNAELRDKISVLI